jgi:fatty acid amide hydrolase
MGGPVAREVGDLALLFRALAPARMTALDPRVPPLGWEPPSSVAVARLRVGWYADDGLLDSSRAIARAVELARHGLADRGCETKAFLPPDIPQLIETYLAALSADGGKVVLEALADGPIDPALQPLRRLAQLPGPARRVAARGAAALGEERLARMLRSMGEKSVAELWSLTDRVRTYRSRLLDAMDDAGVDVLLCPVFATPALVTRVRPEEAQRAAIEPDSLDKRAAAIDEASAGLPVGVQVVGRAWAEPSVLAVMEAIVSSARERDADFPRTPVDPGGRPCAA